MTTISAGRRAKPGVISTGGFGRSFETILADYPDKRVVVVAHGGVIGSFIAQIEGVSPNDWRRHPIANCSLTHLHVTSEHTAVHLFNDAIHLEVLDTDQVES